VTRNVLAKGLQLQGTAHLRHFEGGTMAAVANSPLHLVWNCTWSRVRSPLSTDIDRWICAHEDTPRAIDERECHACPHFECTHGTAADDHLAMPKLTVPGRRGILQGVILLNAALFLVFGFVPLTSVLALPYTVSMWLTAAAFAGFAVFGPIPEA
jgi:hypothetical protein